MRMFLLILATCTLALAIASEDDIIPEVGLIQKLETTSQFEFDPEALKEIRLLQVAGKDDDACRSLAKQTAKEVADNVASSQKQLDAFKSSPTCENAGQDAVAIATQAKAQAEAKAQTAVAAAAKATNADVDFGSVTLDQMKPGNCDNLLSSNAYQSAQAAKKAAESAVAQAKGAAAQALKSLNAAMITAAAARDACFCKWRTTYEATWKAANKSNAENVKAATKAAHMVCVLDGVPAGQCKVTTPTVKQVTLPERARQHCTKWVQKSPAACPASSKTCGFAGSTVYSTEQCVHVVDQKVVADSVCTNWKHLQKPARKQTACAATYACVQWYSVGAPGCPGQSCNSGSSTQVGQSYCRRTNGGSKESDSRCQNQSSPKLGSKPAVQTRGCGAGPTCGPACNNKCSGDSCWWCYNAGHCCDRCPGGNHYCGSCSGTRQCS